MKITELINMGVEVEHALHRSRTGEQDDYEIHAMNADGSCRRALTKNQAFDWSPDWYGPRQAKARLSC